MDSSFHLKNLIIQNFATFKNQTIRFSTGLNAIIGETGSGKSLVLDALQLILGARADKKIVRRNTDCALIEASFTCLDKQVKDFLNQEGYPIEEDEIVIKRLIYKSGATKTYINHLSCNVSFLSSFSKKYIDLVGQFENQKLLSEVYQLQLLDQYAKHTHEVRLFQENFKLLRSLKKQQQDLAQSRLQREQRLDYLNFQLQEIEKLNPSSQEEADLLRKKDLLVNHEKTQKLSYQIKESFEGSEGQAGIIEQLRLTIHLVNKNLYCFQGQIEILSEVEDKLRCFISGVEKNLLDSTDPEEIEIVLDRLDSYQKLKKKFGGSVETILQSQIEFSREKKELETSELNNEELTKQITHLERQLMLEAENLHKTRLLAGKKLSDELTKKVRELKMTGATIKLVLERNQELTDSGLTRAHFMAETNPGEGLFRIKDVASGGELSRILLSLRQILSNHDSISIFLFDEIDTGIGGETANCIGKALKEVSNHGQVIAITHLPQIAQFAESLIVVNKDIHAQNKEARTESTVKEVIGNMIIKEVRAMAQLA